MFSDRVGLWKVSIFSFLIAIIRSMALIYVIIADLLWAGEIIFTKKYFSGKNPIIVAAFASFFATLFYLPTLFVVREKISLKDVILFVFMGIFVYVIPQILYVKGIQENKSAITSSLASLTIPVFTAFLSFFILKETISMKLILGSLIIALGFIIVSIP